VVALERGLLETGSYKRTAQSSEAPHGIRHVVRVELCDVFCRRTANHSTERGCVRVATDTCMCKSMFYKRTARVAKPQTIFATSRGLNFCDFLGGCAVFKRAWLR